MVAAVEPLRLHPMNDHVGALRGAAIRARRENLGWSARAFAARADMSRDTLARVEDDADGVRPATYTQAERALDALAAELGFDDEPAGGIVRYEVPIPGARAIIVSGPVENIAELEQSVARILQMRIHDVESPRADDPSEA